MSTEHKPRLMDVECPNCGEGCDGHPLVEVCAHDEEDWPCSVAAAESLERDVPST